MLWDIGVSLVKPLCYVLLAFHGFNYSKTMFDRVQRNQRVYQLLNPVKSNIDMRYPKYPFFESIYIFQTITHSIHVYIYLPEWLNFYGFHVGSKYTIRPMDPMGIMLCI